MKKIMSAIFLLVLVIFSPSFLHSRVLAATATATAATLQPTPAPVKVEYILPYPGMLPTHPLYVLKTIRDRIIEMLITDPIRKGEFYILQADKMVNMGIFLTNAGNEVAATSAFTDAGKLREKSVVTFETVVKTKQELPRYVAEKLMLSLEKHIEVLTQFHQSTQLVLTLVERAKSLLNVAK